VIGEVPSDMKNSVAGFYKAKVYKIKAFSDSRKDIFCCSVCYHKKYMEPYFSWFEKYVSSKEKKKSRRSSGRHSIKKLDIPIVVEEPPSIAQKRIQSSSSSHPHHYLGDRNVLPSDEAISEPKMRLVITPPEECPPVPPPLTSQSATSVSSPGQSNRPLIQQQREQLTKLVSVLYGQELVMQELQASQTQK
jgi:hypothetical protein